MENPPENLRKEAAERPEKQQGYGISFGFTLDGGFANETGRQRWEYIESLSESERHAYEFALMGVNSDYIEEFGEDALPQGNEFGCTGVGGDAAEAALKEAGLDKGRQAANAFYDILAGEKLNFWEQAQAEPEVQAAQRQYAECLADAGFPGFDHNRSPSLEISERMGVLTQGGTVQPDPQALKELQAYELKAYEADTRCLAPLHQAERRAINARQQAVVDRNKKQLDAWAELYTG